MKTCVRCNTNLQKIERTLICNKCGYVETSDVLEKAQQKRTALQLVGVGFVLVLVMLHAFKWGSHSLAIIFAGDADRVKICMDLRKYDCVSESLFGLYEDTQDTSHLAVLGKLQFRLQNFQESSMAYEKYFATEEDNDLESLYYYTHALVKTGKDEKAFALFEKIIKSKPNTVMVTVAESYLQVLIAKGHYDRARKLLDWMRVSYKRSKPSQDRIKAWKKKYLNKKGA